MDKIKIERIKESIGKEAHVYVKKAYRSDSNLPAWHYFGKITNAGQDEFELLDYKTNSYLPIKYSELTDYRIQEAKDARNN